MLPELLFSVSTSMQDISRDDFSLLNGECDKDESTTSARISLLTSSASPTPAITFNTCPETPPLIATSSISSNIESINIKLEDSNSIPYNNSAWHNSHQSPEFKSTKLLLQNSDDPLISRGATNDDDNPIIVTTLKNHNDSEISKIVKSQTASKKSRNSTNVSGNKTRRKAAFKLRFHHQALPPEYLSHYEMTQNQQNNKLINNNSKNVVNRNSKSKNSINQIEVKNDKKIKSHDTVRDWLEKISQIKTKSTNERKEFMEIEENDLNEEVSIRRSPRKIVKYSDLPYMGEMTLENSKPRRGRKPKKADICHLIYKNYGTILPGTPKEAISLKEKDELKHSLLEKCLSQDSKTIDGLNPNEEPLNLCLRDQSGDAFILSSDDESSDELNSARTSPILSLQNDPLTDAILAANLKMSLPNFHSALLKSKSSSDETLTLSVHGDEKISSNNQNWSDTETLVNPVSLYYQNLIETKNVPSETIPSTATTAATNIKETQSAVSTKKRNQQKNVSKTLPQLLKRDKFQQIENCPTPISSRSTPNNCSGFTSLSQSQPAQKRKRSAIFIPPMPAENTSNPATEVSICKFKFTGGAKPSLQEKKMLSVDSDGNYRYYSGTGDKSMRGYEFFPRETLQQSGVIPGVNCSGAFLNATGEKIIGDFPPSSTILNNELLQLPDSSNSNISLQSSSGSLREQKHHIQRRRQHNHYNSNDNNLSSSSNNNHNQSLQLSVDDDQHKKKSRRSVQREKLEKTFKEKGFLIQTQQLESAEGATYCKFRQLRKFTRYLFRSWKDYLPGEIQQANAAVVAAAAAAAAATAVNKQSASSSTLSSSISDSSSVCNIIKHVTNGNIQLSIIDKSIKKQNAS